MAIICSICGKKQHNFSSDFPLSSTHLQERICSECENRKQKCIVSSRSDFEKYKVCKEEFLSFVSENVSSSVRSGINQIVSECDSHFQEHENVVELKNQISNYMTTSGFSFEGYRITKYIKVLSAETVLGTGFASEFSASVANLLGTETDKFAKKFEKAKDSSFNKLISKAIDLNANALIGVDFDYPLIYNNIIAVIASATAVIVEKIEE